MRVLAASSGLVSALTCPAAVLSQHPEQVDEQDVMADEFDQTEDEDADEGSAWSSMFESTGAEAMEKVRQFPDWLDAEEVRGRKQVAALQAGAGCQPWHAASDESHCLSWQQRAHAAHGHHPQCRHAARVTPTELSAQLRMQVQGEADDEAARRTLFAPGEPGAEDQPGKEHKGHKGHKDKAHKDKDMKEGHDKAPPAHKVCMMQRPRSLLTVVCCCCWWSIHHLPMCAVTHTQGLPAAHGVLQGPVHLRHPAGGLRRGLGLPAAHRRPLQQADPQGEQARNRSSSCHLACAHD